ncbi:hypothetical protein CONCODRAFT_3072 [Conidiobolus coronatus NRRL 28638]|uniref:Uncharacterized protein n=1 Tax=Conidiobolus coronatus (strain ATCC 28846 / CBS 209.66 / NRRL 28638) TaxID=796925 RepID=A0A137PG67_CONC2|nr:hypothetical protein CONCODRAFT_3072 [Conidiobolus coronatus NRRL 28638]|eukprot:KXN73997.1 hypothetical protein CONCODRAFT_3072 [Conidiobolus coronatus NRRL 28638]
MKDANFVIQGIYYNLDFAKSFLEVKKILNNVKVAINARFIINNNITIPFPESLPYCICFPRVTCEYTYRELYRRYPELMYNIARACAIADYRQLCNELNILSETNLMTEAYYTDGNTRSHLLNLDKPMYAVMDELKAEIINPRQVVHNFGCTAICSLLEKNFVTFCGLL